LRLRLAPSLLRIYKVSTIEATIPMNQEAVERVSASCAAPAAHRYQATTLGLAFGLAIVTAAVFAPVRHYGIICFDDPIFVFDNPHIRGGFTFDNIIHAWTQPESGTWRHAQAFYVPFTALSYLLNSQFFGMDPATYHLGNVVFHVLNTLLLFAVLLQMTAEPWRSAWVAAMFALHPLHVESVAWIAERKDVVSACFWMLTLLAYVRYVRRPGVRRYLLLPAGFIAALLSKPSVVTLPFALLLLDAWPLHRLTLPGIPFRPPTHGTSPAMPARRPTTALVLTEKLPLLFLTAVFTILVGIWHQYFIAHAITLGPMRVTSMAARIANAIVSYVAYLGQLCWPTRLAIIYPFSPLPPTQVVAAAVLLFGITLLVMWRVRQQPYLLVGWFWYLGILVPMLGVLRQTENFGVRADRYTYIPSIGIFVIVAWGVPDLLARWRYRHVACTTAAIAALTACIVLSTRQLPVWRNSLSLFQHAVAVTQDNLVGQFVVGNELLQQGHAEAAWEHFVEVTRIAERLRRIDPPYWEHVGPIEPYHSNAEANVGLILVRRGDLDAAKQHYLAALAIDPSYAQAHQRLGGILAAQGDTDGAVAHYRAAVRAEPGFATAHNNLAITLEQLGQTDEALTEYAEGVRLEPENAQSRCNFAAALAGARRLSEAIEQFRIAARLQPQLIEARFGLASAYAQAGQERAAIAEFEQLLREQPEWPPGEAALAWLLATAEDARIRDGARALQLAEDADRRTAHDNPEVLNALAAAYAENGRFREAVATAEQALALAPRRGPSALLTTLPARLAQYRAGQPVGNADGSVGGDALP
jgi:tetratricopeptide (TPR) repeat protein